MKTEYFIIRSIRNWLLPLGVAILLNALLVSFIPGLVSPILERKIEKKGYAGFNLVRIQPPMHPPMNQTTQNQYSIEKEINPIKLEETIQQTPLIPKMELSLQFKTVPPDFNSQIVLPNIKEFSTPEIKRKHQIITRIKNPVAPAPPQKFDTPVFKQIYSIHEIDKPLTPLVQMPPSYPIRARRRKIEGWVDVQFIVNRKGRVEKLKILGAKPEGIFENSVQQTVLSWRFSSGTVNGIPERVSVRQRLRFRLNQ